MSEVVSFRQYAEVLYRLDEGLESPVQLPSCQRRAQTVVGARAEAQMRTGVLSLKVDLVRILKLPWIPVA